MKAVRTETGLGIPGAIREARERKRMTQAVLAMVLDVSAWSVGAWERGEREPSASNLLCLCRVLGLEFSDFWGK